MYTNLNDGGLKMTHIESFCTALKIAWVKRVLDEQNYGLWKNLFYANTKRIGGVYIFLCNFGGSDLNYSGINGFWKNVLFALVTLQVLQPREIERYYESMAME